MIVVYGKDNCRFCSNTKHALMTFDINFKYLQLGEDYTKEDLVGKLPPEHKTFPAIFEGEEFIGGFTEFKKRYFG